MSDINLVSEAEDRWNEHKDFVGHRHEQSVWSLLLKCAILGIPAPSLERGEAPVNVSAKVLTLVKGYEAGQLAEFTRSRCR